MADSSDSPRRPAVLPELERRLAELYPGQAPHDAAPSGTHDYPIDLIRVHASGHGAPHWHHVSYGLSESGHDFELTLRLARTATEREPPRWGAAVLLELSRYVAESGRALHADDHLAPRWRDLPGAEPTEIRAFVLVPDPELPALGQGQVALLQVVGITTDESALLDSPAAVVPLLAALRERSPLLITDLRRASLLDDPVQAEALARATGTALPVGALIDPHLVLRRTGVGTRRTVEISLGAQVVPALLRTAQAALPRGQQVMLVGGRGALVVLRPAPATALHLEPDGVVLDLGPDDVGALAGALQPTRGRYQLATLPELTFEVVPFEIRDAAGTLLRTLG
ncbi:MAG: suppressor of fused domain protein [Deltaproteobacteria bacterium]|nr:suppressor of fused domain protein [Deltaproteobacteria bacterium]